MDYVALGYNRFKKNVASCPTGMTTLRWCYLTRFVCPFYFMNSRSFFDTSIIPSILLLIGDRL